MKNFTITEKQIELLMQIIAEIKKNTNENNIARCNEIVEVLFFVANKNLA